MSLQYRRASLYYSFLRVIFSSSFLPKGGKQGKVILPPGTLTGSVLKFLMKPAAFRRWVYPALAEMQEEYFEALRDGRHGYARCVWIRGLIYLIPGGVWGLFFATLKKLFTSS